MQWWAALLVGVMLATAVLVPLLRVERHARTQSDLLVASLQYELTAHQHEAEVLNAMFGALLDAFPRPVLVTDSDRIVLYANLAALALTHLPHALVVGRVAATVIQDYDTTRLLRQAAETDEPCERTFQRPTTGQTWRVAVTPLRLRTAADHYLPTDAPPKVTHLILTIEDLTELRRLELMRTDFVAHVSHELRTPLAALKLLAETLLGVLESDPAAAREFAQRIGNEIDHLSQMVAELLELSRIESGKIVLHTEPTDIAGLTEVVLDRMGPLADERQLHLSSEIPADLPDVQADGSRTGEVLVNLIHNAVKYTPPGGAVRVTASLVDVRDIPAAAFTRSLPPPPSSIRPAQENTPAHTQMVVVRVSDTGVGIGSEDLPRVFERFFKTDRARTREPTTSRDQTNSEDATDSAQSRAAAGTGLGLAIAKHLVELHGGHIWAESRLEHGSVFSFALPLAAPVGAGTPPAPTDAPGKAGAVSRAAADGQRNEEPGIRSA